MGRTKGRSPGRGCQLQVRIIHFSRPQLLFSSFALQTRTRRDRSLPYIRSKLFLSLSERPNTPREFLSVARVPVSSPSSSQQAAGLEIKLTKLGYEMPHVWLKTGTRENVGEQRTRPSPTRLTSFDVLLRPTAITELPRHDQTTATPNSFVINTLCCQKTDDSESRIDDLRRFVLNVNAIFARLKDWGK